MGYGYELSFNKSRVKRLFMVMNYCSGGNLEEYITTFQKQERSIPEKTILSWITCLAKAVKYAHACGVINGDIK